MAPIVLTTTEPLAETLPRDLARFSGTEQYYRHGMIRSVYHTDGVQYLAEQAGAHWLIDIVAIAQRYKPRVRVEGFQVWRLKRFADHSATITCDDGDGPGHVVYHQRIPFTDFPLETLTLYCCDAAIQGDRDRCIMLTSEY